MAITHPTTVRNSVCDHIVDKVDSGTTDAAGDFVIKDGGTTLVSITLQDPSFGTASTGTANLQGSPSSTASATGTADTFTIQNKDNSAIINGTITGDLSMSSTTVNSGETVKLTSFSYSAPN